MFYLLISFFFFFNDTATTEIYPLSLPDALPILVPRRPARSSPPTRPRRWSWSRPCGGPTCRHGSWTAAPGGSCRRRRSEEHTSELQSRQYLVCRLLLEKKKKIKQRKI